MNILRQFSVPANQSQNIVTGSAFEYPQVPSQVSAGVNGAAAGLFITIYAGARLIAEEFVPRTVAAYPVVPDDFYFNFIILPGERLVFNARNSTGAAVVAWLAMDMQQVGR